MTAPNAESEESVHRKHLPVWALILVLVCGVLAAKYPTANLVVRFTFLLYPFFAVLHYARKVFDSSALWKTLLSLLAIHLLLSIYFLRFLVSINFWLLTGIVFLEFVAVVLIVARTVPTKSQKRKSAAPQYQS